MTSMRWLLPALSAWLLTSCSAAILAIGRDEQSIIHWNSKKADIENELGTPIEAQRLPSPVPIRDLNHDPHVNALKDPSDLAVSRETYVYHGRVERRGEVGDAMALAGFTFGLSELFMVPAALVWQDERGHTTHHVTVWYAPDGTAAAYNWRSTVDDTGKEYP